MESNFKSYDESKNDYIDKMGADLGSLYHLIWNEVAMLNLKWAEYKELYATKEERIKLLNDSASTFFRIVQDSLICDIFMQISRITDPLESCGEKNFTMKMVPLYVENENLKQNLTDSISSLDEKIQFIRNWRNKIIGHNDYYLFIKGGAQAIDSTTIEQINECLSTINDIINLISIFYTNSTVVFNLTPVPGGAVDLIYVLADGIKHDKERQERIQSHQPTNDDLIAPNL